MYDKSFSTCLGHSDLMPVVGPRAERIASANQNCASAEGEDVSNHHQNEMPISLPEIPIHTTPGPSVPLWSWVLTILLVENLGGGILSRKGGNRMHDKDISNVCALM